MGLSAVIHNALVLESLHQLSFFLLCLSKGWKIRNITLDCWRRKEIQLNVYIYGYIYICIYMYMYIYIYMCVCVCVCVYVYICIYLYIFVYICVYIYIYIYIHTYIYIYTHTHVYIYINIRIYLYVCIYIYIYSSLIHRWSPDVKRGRRVIKFRVTMDKRGEKEFENDHFPRASFKLIQHNKHSNKNYVFV